MEKIIFEFKEDRKKKTPGFVPTAGLRKSRLPGGLTIDKKGVVREPDGTAARATDDKVIRALNLDPANNNCFDDFKENFWSYMGLGTLAALTFAPIGVPAVRALSKGFSAGAHLLMHPQSTIIRWGEKINNINTAKAFEKLKKAPAASLRWISFVDNYKSTWAQMKQAGILSKLGGVSRGGFYFTKHLVIIAFFVSLGYNFIWKKWIKSDDKTGVLDQIDNDAFQKTLTMAELAIEFFINFELAIDYVILMMNPDLERDCIITNTILTAIGVTFAAQIAAPGLPGPAQGFNALKLSKIKSADELADFVAAQRALKLEKINKEVISELVPIAESFGVSNKLLKKYYGVLIKDPKEALTFLKEKSKLDPKKITSFHKKSMKTFNRKKEEVIMAMNKEITKNQSDVAALIGKDSDLRTSLRGLINNTGEQVLKAARALGFFNPRAGTQAVQGANLATKAADATSDVKKALTNPNLAKLSVGSVDEMAKSINSVEDLLLKNKVNLDEAAVFFHDKLSPGMRQFSKSIIQRSPELKATKDAGDRIENLISVLATLNKNEDLLTGSIKALAPKAQAVNPNWIDKIFQTRVARESGALIKQRESLDLLRQTKKQILKLNSNITPQELVKLEKSIENVYQSLGRSSNLINPTGRAHNSIILSRAVLGGATMAVILGVAKQILSDDLDDIETWQSQNLARDLAWGSWNPAAEDEYAKSIIRLIDKVITSPNITRTIFDKFIFNKPDVFIQENMLNLKNGNEVDVLSLVNKLRREKSNNDAIKNFAEQQLGASLKGFGTGFSPSSRSVQYRERWHPVIMSILVANSGLVEKMTTKVKRNKSFFNKNDKQKIVYLKKNVFVWEDREVEDNLQEWSERFVKEMERKKIFETKKINETQENNKMSQFKNDEIKNAVLEVLTENYGKGYSQYPYHSEVGMEDEESPDFLQDWKDFEMALVRDETRETAIALAKILIKDLELFGDVVDLIGKNQSVATEILKSFRELENK